MPAKSACPSCGKTFVSLEAFDAHRTGRFRNNTRRCLTEQEMRAAGMRQNSKGWGVVPAQSEAQSSENSVFKR